MDWTKLLHRAVKVEGSQAAVVRKLGCSASQLSQVLGGTYPGDTEKIAAKVVEVYGDKGALGEIVPDGYKKNGLGYLVPIEKIKDEDLDRDEFVMEMVRKAKNVSHVVSTFKISLTEDMQAFLDLAAEKYGATLGGVRGNVTLTSFDGRYQIQRAMADRLDFNENLQAAKALIDECLREWTKDSRAEVWVVIDEAFQVDRKGKINVRRILSLRKLNIDDEKWTRAMKAIDDSLTVTGSSTYYRIYEKDASGKYRQLQLDFSGV